jgi:hypothetical protein
MEIMYLTFDDANNKKKFERTLHFLTKHPNSSSAWNELRYDYYYKGYFQEEIKKLLFSDNLILVRGAAATLSEFGCDPSWLNDLESVFNKIDDLTTRYHLLLCIKKYQK